MFSVSDTIISIERIKKGLKDTMVSLITTAKAQKKLAEHARARRLQMELTQEGLAERSGVALPTLRKFERTGALSLESFLKLHMVLGGLEDIVKATQVKDTLFSSIDDVLEESDSPTRKRGKRK
jgi:transcriptional regulator with XRE-family HTH domain